MSRKEYKYREMKMESNPSSSGASQSQDDEENQSLISAELLSHPAYTKSHRRRWLQYGLFFFLALSILINIVTVAQLKMVDLDDICSLYTSQAISPIFEDVKVTYQTRQFDGKFMNASKYTQDPSPQVDEFWMQLGVQNRHYRVPEHLATKYGLNPGHARLGPEFGGGYPVLFEFEHHLHCIDLLRQATYWNYDYYQEKAKGPFANAPPIVKTHVNHCIDILRQVIMCQPDLGVFGQYWIQETNEPFVDFHTDHKCKNFHEIRQWVADHQIPEDIYKDLKVTKRPDDIILEKIP
ncbi:hypothetical protein AJ79_04210 [Helicocarpus griseus UAMH5409]|uniref:Tat pathway signal sequence n=1 Tax=Helicocarpus griseus UAMH5409 TaxID=1447875 RepID=A0A2B7XUE1_9EURO|nr:hypothetical protein AJ79_04210 [Helicocarpus griseus UAMH5409]